MEESQVLKMWITFLEIYLDENKQTTFSRLQRQTGDRYIKMLTDVNSDVWRKGL